MGLITATERVDVPHEEGEWFELKALNGKKLENAREERTFKVLRQAREMGASFITELRASRGNDADVQEALRDPLNDYDKWALCRYGIKAWSYETKLSPDSIEDLDEPTLDWAAREILRLSGVDADPEAAAKNG